MGTDIHPVIEVRNADGVWVTHEGKGPTYRLSECGDEDFHVIEERNYTLFQVLANVRGTVRFLEPIAEPRGLPEDGGYECKDVGCHGYSFVTLHELLAYPWRNTIRKYGVISKDDYIRWDGKPPGEYSRSVGGPATFMVDESHYNDSCTHVGVWWSDTVGSMCKDFVEEVLPWLVSLAPDGDTERVRMVFGFDS